MTLRSKPPSGWFETHGAVTRRGTDGVLQVDTQGIVAGLFRQHTSRTADPQLHTHAVITAKVQDPTGRWLSLDARFLMRQQRTIGWIYDAALRAELTTRLGVAWDTPDTGPIDLTCIPASVRDALSQRSGQVEAKLAELIGRWSTNTTGPTPTPAPSPPSNAKPPSAPVPGRVPGPVPHHCTGPGPGPPKQPGSTSTPSAPTASAALRCQRRRSDEDVIAEAIHRVSRRDGDLAAGRSRPPHRHPPPHRLGRNRGRQVEPHRPTQPRG